MHLSSTAKLTAGFAAARVKDNLELRADPARMKLLIRILMASLGHHRTFRFGALPHQVANPIFARYRPGMTYGDHVDDPIMGSTGPRLRSDVAMTIFLNQPETYDRGEQAIRTSFGEELLKHPSRGCRHLSRLGPAPGYPHNPGRAPGSPDLSPELRARPRATGAALRAQPGAGKAAARGAGRGDDGIPGPVLRKPATDVGGGLEGGSGSPKMRFAACPCALHADRCSPHPYELLAFGLGSVLNERQIIAEAKYNIAIYPGESLVTGSYRCEIA